MARRKLQELDASSIADIAFILLAFIIIATTLEKESGLPAVLPQKRDAEVDPPKANERNILEILVNSNDQLMIEGEWDKEIEVEIDTLDSIILEHGKPSFIKIDVEGFEYDVLKGLSSPIKYISCEYTVPERTESLVNCINRITEISGEHKVMFNYSVGESMKWALTDWLTSDEMVKEVNKQSFIDTDFGDIYSKIEI